MALIERLEREKERDYIGLYDFIWGITDNGHDESVPDICIYLLRYQFEDKVKIYTEGIYYDMWDFTEQHQKDLHDFLIEMAHSELEFDENLEPIERGTDELIEYWIDKYNYPNIFFEKKELLSLDFLKYLLHFDDLPQDKGSEQQSPSFLPAPLPYDELLAEKERLVTEIWKLLEQRDTATELLKTEQQEKNLLKEENAQLHAKIAELTAKSGEIGQQSIAINDNDKKLSSRTANNASKIISALASELLGMDLTKPFADDSNGKIMQAIEKQGNKLSKDTIAEWLKLAHDNSK